MFGVYDHTNDRMFTHCYKHKKSNQFIDFINRVDLVYDSNIKRIFVVLDNASIHKSKKTREALTHHHPRIVPVFLPTKSPKKTQSNRSKMDVAPKKSYQQQYI